jgi:hypothetical protein
LLILKHDQKTRLDLCLKPKKKGQTHIMRLFLLLLAESAKKSEEEEEE